MYRKIFRAENKDDLMVELPDEYLHKQVEVIAFQISEEDLQLKKQKAKEAIEFFKTLQVDMSNFKFNREEANER